MQSTWGGVDMSECSHYANVPDAGRGFALLPGPSLVLRMILTPPVTSYSTRFGVYGRSSVLQTAPLALISKTLFAISGDLH